MADIKTRKTSTKTIKTLDRAASAMHHVRIADIKSRSTANDTDRDDDNKSLNEYVQNRIRQTAGNTTYAVRKGTEAVRSRRENAIVLYEDSFPEPEGISKGVKVGGISISLEGRNLMNGGGGVSIDNCKKTQKKAIIPNSAVKKQSEYGKKKLIRESIAGEKVRLFTRGSRSPVKMAEFITYKIDEAKVLIRTFTSGGMLSVGIIILMILFGAALTMTEDGGYITWTGDTAIVEVARKEIGNVGGDKFWKWYGFSSHVDWCCCFVSWCSEQCGYIDDGSAPKFALCVNGVSWYKTRHRWAGRGYTPHPGNTIFFDYQGDGVCDHVGIVETYDGKTITTIEGNSGNTCRRNSYTVGSAQIAGYGLIVRPAGNKGKMIAAKAIELAYPDARKEARYPGGRPTAAYAAALDRAYPHRSHWQASCKVGASCDVFVGVCLVDSGVDKKFPRGYDEQLERLRKRTDLYECVISTTSRDIQESELSDGDIIQYDRKDGGGHICIYAGGKLRHAGIYKWYPRTTAPGNRIKIKGKRHIWVYRIKE